MSEERVGAAVSGWEGQKEVKGSESVRGREGVGWVGLRVGESEKPHSHKPHSHAQIRK